MINTRIEQKKRNQDEFYKNNNMQITHKKLAYMQEIEQKTQDQISSGFGMKECRICLENQISRQNILFSPCNCTGSLKYVHHECLDQWIGKIVNSRSQKIDSQKAHISCELCNGRISFGIKKAFTCKNRQETLENMKANIKTFLALVALLLINVSFFLAILDYIVKYGFNSLRKNNEVLVSLFLSGEVIFSIVCVVTIFAIVRKFFLNRQYMVLNIKSREEQDDKKTYK